MPSLALAGSAALALIAFAALLLPPGYALLRGLGARATGLAGLTLALAAGYTLVMPLVWVESLLGGPYLVVPCSLVSLLWLRPGAGSLAAARALGRALPLAVCFAALAFFVSRHDVEAVAGGLAFRPGFDVSDRVFYAAVAHELGRASPAAVENPVFAGLPLQYAFLPCLVGLFLGSYVGLPLALVFLVLWPVVGLFFVGVAVLGFLEEAGVDGVLARGLTALLVVLGGDLSLLVPKGPSAFERFAHFFVFHSFSAESLFYNPWMFGLPLTLAFLIAARRFLSDGRARALGLSVLLALGLWQTKAFAVAALLAGALLAALALRRARLAIVVSACLVGVAPLALWAMAEGAAREGAPLRFAPLVVVRASLAAHPSLAALAERLGILGFVPLFLVGGLGLRLIGVPRLVREARGDATGFGAWLLSSLAVMLVAGLSVAGNPTPIEGVQFLLLAQMLLWLSAGPTLAGLLSRHALVGAPLVALAVASPIGYLARKTAPALWSAQGALDADRVEVSEAALAACRFLARHAAPEDRVLVPVDGPSGAAAARGLFLAALAGRRVPAIVAPVHLSRQVAASRISSVRTVYATEDAALAESIIDALDVAWVWEDEDHRLRFRSPRLEVGFAKDSTRLQRVSNRE